MLLAVLNSTTIYQTLCLSQCSQPVSQTFFHQHSLCHLLFADDMQGHYSCLRTDAPAIVRGLENCVCGIADLCAAKRLQINADKTELLWCGSTANLRKIPPDSKTVTVNTSIITPATVVRDLGVWFDEKLSNEHVSSCFSCITDVLL